MDAKSMDENTAELLSNTRCNFNEDLNPIG